MNGPDWQRYRVVYRERFDVDPAPGPTSVVGHAPRTVTVTVECSCGACGDRIVQTDYPLATAPDVPPLIEAAVGAFTDHLRGNPS